MGNEDSTGDVGTEDLTKAINELVAAAGASDLVKKGGVDNSGFHGSAGKQGGGQGSESDAGPIDNLMIAKMIQAGVDVSHAASFVAFMRGDKKKTDEDEWMERSAPAAADLAKSFRDSVVASFPAESADMLDITPYLDGLTGALGEQLARLDTSIAKSDAKHTGVNTKLAAALHQMGSLLKSELQKSARQSAIIEELGSRLGLVEKAPVAAPKGATGTATAKPLHKSMPGEAGAPDGEIKLTKSSALSALSYMNLVKGERMIGGQSTTDVIVGIESAGVYDADTHNTIQSFLRKLTPDERAQALTF